MVNNWLENLGNHCPDGYQVSDGPGFEMRARDVIGDIAKWDEIRRNHDLALTRKPYCGEPIYGGELWATRIDYGDSLLVLFYTIDEDNCVVRYRDLRRF